MKKSRVLYYILMFLPLVITLFALLFLPEKIPAHYNFEGEVDRWGSKYEALIFPFCTIAMGLFMLFMAKISAKDENGKKNEKIVLYTGMGISVWFTVMHCYSLYMDFKLMENLNDVKIDINSLFCIVLGIGIAVMGNFLPKLRSNGVIGLRTPWSMKNDTVWRKCQVFAGVSLVAGGVLAVFCGFVLSGFFAMFAALGIILLCAVSGTVYSYFISKKY